ncbi:MAG: discoidin domain-containing protein [Prevotellaceae bacterium]|jgi:hypothetical protein|nr:discoidin domain-containing protein [Prevotellaceae bacterium]
MKTSNICKYLFLLVATATVLSACESDPTFDVTGDTANKVYINTWLSSPNSVPNNGIVFTVTNTPVGTVITGRDSISYAFTVQCTRPAEAPINITLGVNNAMVPEGMATCPESIRLYSDKPGVVIPAGATVSDSITVWLKTDELAALGTDNYALPVGVVAATNAQISANRSVAYFILNAAYSNIQGATTPSGSTFTKPTGAASWTVTGIATNPQYMLDASTSTGQYASTGANPALPLDVVIDMKEPYTITGFHTRTSSTTYRPTAATIYTRLTEDDEWTRQGNIAWTTSPQYVRFYGPVTTRYVRISISAINSANGVRYTDFVIYR